MSDVNGNTLCESNVQSFGCSNIPEEYFNQHTTIVDSAADETELLVALTSFFGGYAVLFIAFLVFTLCRNKGTNSKYKKPLRVIIITVTILIETFDVLTDIAQTNNVINGVECGATSCIKQDVAVGYLMAPCIAIGTIATIISLYTFCKTTTFNMYDDDLQEKKYKKLDRISDFMKIWGENVPMLLLGIYWVFAGGGFLKKFSFLSTTFIVSIIISAFNFYWQVVPLICCCCCKKNDNDNAPAIQHQQQQQMELGVQAVSPQTVQPTQPIVTAPVFVQQQPMIVAPVQQPIVVNTDQLPPGWSAKIDPNGRVYYANDVTQMTQWERPQMTVVPQYAPSNPSLAAPKPMQQPQHIEPQFSGNSINNDNAVATYDSPESYYETNDDDLSCCGKACVWCGCVVFSFCFGFLWIFVQLFVILDSVDLNQDQWIVMSTDDGCIEASNFYWEMDDNLYSNATGQAYPLYMNLQTSGIRPILWTGDHPAWAGEPYQDDQYPCYYTAIPDSGQCLKWIFDCRSLLITYKIDQLCFDFCGS